MTERKTYRLDVVEQDIINKLRGEKRALKRFHKQRKLAKCRHRACQTDVNDQKKMGYCGKHFVKHFPVLAHVDDQPAEYLR